MNEKAFIENVLMPAYMYRLDEHYYEAVRKQEWGPVANERYNVKRCTWSGALDFTLRVYRIIPQPESANELKFVAAFDVYKQEQGDYLAVEL